MEKLNHIIIKLIIIFLFIDDSFISNRSPPTASPAAPAAAPSQRLPEFPAPQSGKLVRHGSVAATPGQVTSQLPGRSASLRRPDGPGPLPAEAVRTNEDPWGH